MRATESRSQPPPLSGGQATPVHLRLAHTFAANTKHTGGDILAHAGINTRNNPHESPCRCRAEAEVRSIGPGRPARRTPCALIAARHWRHIGALTGCKPHTAMEVPACRRRQYCTDDHTAGDQQPEGRRDCKTCLLCSHFGPPVPTIWHRTLAHRRDVLIRASDAHIH